MDSRIAHGHFISFAVSAMLTSAILVEAPNGLVAAAAGPQLPTSTVLAELRTTDWPGSAAIRPPVAVFIPASAPTNTPPLLNDNQLNWLLLLVQKKGHDSNIDTSVTTTLGLTKPSEVLIVRQFGLRDNGIYRFFNTAKLNNSDNIYLIGNVSPEETRVYYLDAKLNLLGAVIKNAETPAITMPPTEAEENIIAELRYWAAIADRIQRPKTT